MSILSRYILWEILKTLFIVILVLLFIFLCNQFFHYIAQLPINNSLSFILFIRFIAIQIPILMGFILPLAIFFALLTTLSKFYLNSEMIIILTRKTPFYILKLVLLLLIIISSSIAFHQLYLEPRLLKISDQWLLEAKTALMRQLTTPNLFQELSNGRWVYYFENSKNSYKTNTLLNNIFIISFNPEIDTNKQCISLTLARQGSWNTNTGLLQLDHGVLYQGFPGQANFHVAYYAHYFQSINLPTLQPTFSGYPSILATSYLWHHRNDQKNNLLFWAELQWRAAIPIAVIIAGLLALPFSRTTPRRGGRFIKTIFSTILLLIYTNLLLFGRAWVASGKMPVTLGLWSIHLIFLLITLFFIIRWLRCPID